MYLTAQHVRSPHGIHGINSYIYGHGPLFWLGWPPFLPEDNPGTLYDHDLEIVPPGGNRILAFLDIMTPDSSGTAPKVRSAFDMLMALYPRAGIHFPDGVEVGDAWFRYAAPQPLLAENAELELRTLFEHACRLLQVRAPA